MQNHRSLAYVPREFLEIGALIASWTLDEEIYATLPEEHESNGRVYLITTFGHCPEQSGVLGIFAYDEMNEEYLYWETEGRDDYDYSATWQENCERLDPLRFSDLKALHAYIAHGDL